MPPSRPYHWSQSLCFQGFLLTEGDQEYEGARRVSIPLFSGLSADCLISPKLHNSASQSLCFQGFLLTALHEVGRNTGASQSLCFQGFLLTITRGITHEVTSVSIPLFSGLSADTIILDGGISGESQSLCFQGFLLTISDYQLNFVVNVSIPLFSGLSADAC